MRNTSRSGPRARNGLSTVGRAPDRSMARAARDGSARQPLQHGPASSLSCGRTFADRFVVVSLLAWPARSGGSRPICCLFIERLFGYDGFYSDCYFTVDVVVFIWFLLLFCFSMASLSSCSCHGCCVLLWSCCCLRSGGVCVAVLLHADLARAKMHGQGVSTVLITSPSGDWCGASRRTGEPAWPLAASAWFLAQLARVLVGSLGCR